MAGLLEVRLIGKVSVLLDGEELALAQSKKCRALIAYLAMTGRPQRRERLCELLWEIPDDPRGALRWSLSKIRRVLGDALVADRETVSIDAEQVHVDATRLRSAADRLTDIPTGLLEELADHCGSPFGEGLDLPRCPEFESWLAAEREDVRRAQAAILAELALRHRAEPERALPFARMRAAADPLNEQAIADLIAILAEAGRAEEAERQRAIASAMLGEAGVELPVALSRPVRSVPKGNSKLSQRIQFCTAPDGTRIAHSTLGMGPLLIKTANWMSHLEFELDGPLLRHWIEELSGDRRLVRYDARGSGLSDRRPPDLSLGAFVQDLETVAATVGEKKFDLIGISQGCSVAIEYAARHPEKVGKLVLFGGFATGWRHSPSSDVHARWEAMITLTEFGWGQNNPAFRQMFTSLFAPRATVEQADWFNEFQRVSASPTEAQRLQRAIGEFDVSHRLASVRAPTIVFHCRGDALVSWGNGLYMASNIPGAEFVGLESDNHLPLEDEPAWTVFVEKVREFLSR